MTSVATDHERLSFEEWAEHSAADWAAMLRREWEQPLVSLSAAVYWIALSGKPGEPSDDAAEKAARDLLDAARSGVGNPAIQIVGQRSASAPAEAVPAEHLFFVFPFFGEPDAVALRAYENGTPCLQWNSLLERDRDDRIASITDRALWCGLKVKREELQVRWPAHVRAQTHTQ